MIKYIYFAPNPFVTNIVPRCFTKKVKEGKLVQPSKIKIQKFLNKI